MPERKIIDVRKIEGLDINYDLEICEYRPGLPSVSLSQTPAEIEDQVNRLFEAGLIKIL